MLLLSYQSLIRLSVFITFSRAIIKQDYNHHRHPWRGRDAVKIYFSKRAYGLVKTEEAMIINTLTSIAIIGQEVGKSNGQKRKSAASR